MPARSSIPSPPLHLLCFGLTLAALPLSSESPKWVCAAFILCALYRCWLNHRNAPLPSAWPRFAGLLLGVGGVYLTYGTLAGAAAGFGILVILIALKLLETNSRRDFQVVSMLGYFLALSDLFFSQELPRWLTAVASVLTLTFGLIRFHLGNRTSASQAFRLAWKLVAQASPLVILLFLFFPRVHGEFKFMLGQPGSGMTGMSDNFEPGSFASILQHEDVAFRASFPDGAAPAATDLYWRGLVFWNDEGLTWKRGGRLGAFPQRPKSRGLPIHQKIILEPHGRQWLFALDRPVSSVPNANYDPGGALLTERAVLTRRQYEVDSQPVVLEKDLPKPLREAAVRLPKEISPEIKALAATLNAGAGNESQTVAQTLKYFTNGHFTYTLSPGEYRSNELDEFLFRRKAGCCEHYAAAFATLMRVAGIPARVVVGYAGGEFSDIGNYVIVRQSDAHAWCEVWYENAGWRRIDPTSAIAPDRLSAGMQQLLGSSRAHTGAFGSNIPGAKIWSSLWRQTSLVWDDLSYQWDLRVLSYDQETQRSFLAVLGLGMMDLQKLSLGLGLVLAALITGQAIWIARRLPTAGDAAERSFARFCRRAARAGFPRALCEGSSDFTERVAAHFPAISDQIRKIGTAYAAIRYGRIPPPHGYLEDAIRDLPRLQHAPAKSQSTSSPSHLRQSNRSI